MKFNMRDPKFKRVVHIYMITNSNEQTRILMFHVNILTALALPTLGITLTFAFEFEFQIFVSGTRSKIFGSPKMALSYVFNLTFLPKESGFKMKSIIYFSIVQIVCV